LSSGYFLRKQGDGWRNLLDRWGLLEHDTQIARWMRMIAFLMCVGSILVAVWITTGELGLSNRRIE
jgi:hypothetical protein